MAGSLSCLKGSCCLPGFCTCNEARTWMPSSCVVLQFLLPKGPETARLLDDEFRVSAAQGTWDRQTAGR